MRQHSFTIPLLLFYHLLARFDPSIVPLFEFYDFVATLDKDVSGFLTSSPATAIDRQHLAHRKYGEGIRLEVIFEYVDVDRVFDMARLKLLCRTNIQAHYGGIGYQFLESIR